MRSLVLLLAVVTVAVLALPATRQKQRRFLTFGRPPWGFGPNAPSRRRNQGDTTRVTQDWFDQKLDHFDNSSTTTWRQQYWTNNQYYQDGSPAFLYIGGEGPESGSDIGGGNGLLFMDIARTQKAYVFDLEHRYYGSSHPTSDMSTANLAKYLNSYQAIEDIADFITAMNAKFFPNGAPTWVTFGGSYPGSLSSYIRLKHPELVSFSVGSSAPVLAQLDFVGYLEIVRAAITDVSADCAASIQQGFQQVATLAQSGSGRETLRTTFNLCDALPASGDNVLEFYNALLTWYMVADQYAGIEFNLQSDVCRYHTNTADPVLTRMKKLNDHFNAMYGQPCTYIDFAGNIEFYQDTSYGQAQSDRAWVFQTCNEYGYFQSTDSTQDFWSGGLPVDYYINTCTGIFGQDYNQAHIQAAVDQSNQYFGGITPASTKVIFPNGSYDPWHGLAILPANNTNADNVPLFATGTAHCDDMYSQSSGDNASIKQVKQSIIDTLNTWLTASKKK